MLALVDAFLHQPIFEGLAQWTVEEGTPQGAVISPLLANLYLDPLDHAMAAAGFEMVRYADDFVVLCRTAEEAQQALRSCSAGRSRQGCGCIPRKRISWICSNPAALTFSGITSSAAIGGLGRKACRSSKTRASEDRRTHGHSLAVMIAD